MTAGAALVVAGKAENLKSAIVVAREAIASGAASRALTALIEVSNG